MNLSLQSFETSNRSVRDSVNELELLTIPFLQSSKRIQYRVEKSQFITVTRQHVTKVFNKSNPELDIDN